MTALPKQLYFLYRDGFRSMVVGKTLWKIIAVKLFIMFAVFTPSATGPDMFWKT